MRRQLRRGASSRRGTASGSARRGSRLAIALLLALALSGVAANIGPLPAAAANAIQLENQNPGDPTWDDFASVANQDAISGYGSKISVNHGDAIDFYVTTTAASLTIDIFRMGWYGGAGARKMTSLGTFPGVHQTPCTTDSVTGMVSCLTWSKTATLAVPSSWVTGAYLAKLSASSGNKSYIFFVVRNDGGHEAIEVQTSVTTYQAYNAYGGISLYTNTTNGSVYKYAHATKVSFDRPFDPNDSNGAGHFLYAEYSFIRWAESQGYDLTYATDVDTHSNVNPLTNHQAFLSVGHDEYWSMGMRTNVQNAINSGVNVGFLGANDMYWQIRFEPNANGVADRVQVGYKDTAIFNTAPGPDPMFGVNNAIVTTNWRDTPVNMPENAVIGVMYDGQVSNNNYPYVVQNASNWVYTGTGLSNGNSVPGIVGYEFDKVWNNGATPAGLTALSNSPVCCSDTQWDTGGNSTSQATIYTAPSGARVFAAGSIDWAWGLDNYASGNTANAGIQKMTANILNNFISGGTSSAPAVTLSPTSLTFNSQTVGTTSAAQAVTLTNSGNAALSITAIGLSGSNPGDFAQTNTCPLSPSTLAVGANCTISVTFSPSATGNRAASVSIADNAAGSPQSVGLTGTGATAASPAVTLAPTSLTFAGQQVGTTSSAQTVTLTNSGSAALTISSIGLAGANPGDFAQTNTCPIGPSTLAAGGTCTISVTVTPSASGSRTASVSITDDAADSPQSLPLSGSGTSTTSTSLAAMPVISRGVPAYASNISYPPSYGNDSDYSTVWDSSVTPSTSNPAWLAYDLSGVPAANRTNVVLAWYNDDTGDYIQAGSYYGLPSNYTIEANAAPGGGIAAPSSGWVTLVTVTGNTYTGREHTLNLSGYNWVRMSVTAVKGQSGANDATFQMDIHDISQGNQDNWLFLGDSITMEGFNHHNIDGSAWAGGNYQQLINAAQPPYFPLVIDGGAGATTMQWGYDNRVALLQNFTGQYVAISFGTNDANVSGALDATTVNTWYSNLLGLVDYVTSLGKTPVVGEIPWGNASGGWLATNAQTLNSRIDQLYTDRPQVIHGPDLYTFFNAHQNLINNDGIHPTYDHSVTAGTYQGFVGYEWLQREWRDAMLANVYNASAPTAPAVTLSPTSLTFSGQPVGTTSAAQTLTLANSGNADLTISAIGLNGTNPGDFAQTNTCPISPATLAAGATCTVSVTFSPTAGGSRSAAVSLTDNAGGSPQSVALSGTGQAPGAGLSPASLTFAGQPTGTTSAAQSVTLTNTGNAALTISSIGVTGTNPADFGQTNTCPLGPSTLAAGASCTISVTFSPTAAGTRTASVSISDDAAGSPQTIGLTGTGTTPAPVVSLSPASLTFGNQPVGTTSTAQSVTLTNTGNAALSISSVGLSGANPGDFAQTTTCPISPNTLAAAGSCTISVSFTPTATGSRAASVAVSDNAAGSPQSVGLAGTGTAPGTSLSPTNLTFSSQVVGTASSAQTVTLTNTGSAALTVSSIGLSGTNAGDFAQTNTCPLGPATLAAGAKCTIGVTFKPTATGARTATLAVADDATGSPQTVGLSGTGVTTSNVLFSDGFESGSLPGAWTSKTVSSGNTLALDTSLFHSGTASLKAVKVKGKAGNAKVSKSIAGQTTLDARGYYYLSSPVNWGAVQLLSFYAQGNFIGWVSYYVDPSSPTLTVLNGANGVSYNCTLPSLNAWHSIELQYVLATTATGSFTLWIDGVQACAKSGIKTMPSSGLTINQVVVGIDSADNTAGLTVHVDDVVISKSYIGP